MLPKVPPPRALHQSVQGRQPAPHVRNVVAPLPQAKLPGAPAVSQRTAPHVHAAVSTVQAKLPENRQPAPHVQAALGVAREAAARPHAQAAAQPKAPVEAQIWRSPTAPPVHWPREKAGTAQPKGTPPLPAHPSTRVPPSAPVRRAIQCTREEAEALLKQGETWASKVWIEGSDDERNKIVKEVNSALQSANLSFYVGRGMQSYDPVVKTSKGSHLKGNNALTYEAIAQWASGQKDGGVKAAQDFQDWYSGSTPLSSLDEHLEALALITHFAEVGRIYESALTTHLYPWIKEIASATDAKTAMSLWLDYRNRYPPSLTHAEDLRQEVTTSELKKSELTASELKEELSSPPTYEGSSSPGPSSSKKPKPHNLTSNLKKPKKSTTPQKSEGMRLRKPEERKPPDRYGE